MTEHKEDSGDIWFGFYMKEIGLQQLRARLKDIGWTEEEIEDGLDGDSSEDD